MNILSKKCKKCGKEFFKKSNVSVKTWLSGTVKYCSQECQYESLLGQTAWNKGKSAPWAKNLPQQFKKGHSKPKNAFKWQANEKHPHWKGEKVSNNGIHKWIIRKLGNPQKCELCKTTKAKKYEWANKDHKYSRNLEDWIRLCTSCHRKYDIENNNYPIKGHYGTRLSN